jgi:hypothetical protein
MAIDTKYTIELRRGSASDWTAINPILHDGEPGYEEDTRLFKIGDGITHWNDLEYAVQVGPPGNDGTDGTDGVDGNDGADGSEGASYIDRFTATADQTAFVTSITPTGVISVFVNGLLQRLTTDYTVSGSTVTLTTGALVGDSVTLMYGVVGGTAGPAGEPGDPGPPGDDGAPGAPGPAAWTTVATWTASTAYTVGPPASVVTYLGETYVCTTSHTSTGSFDATKWTKVAAKGVDSSGGSATKESFTATAGQTVFTLSGAGGADLMVFRNGLLQRLTTDYTVSGNVVTLTTGALVGDAITVVYGSSVIAGLAYDVPPGGASDLEFTTTGSTIPNSGAWLNQQSGDTFETHSGKAIISLLGAAFTYVRGVEWDCPATSAWQAIIKADFLQYGGGEPVIYLRDSSGGVIAAFTWRATVGWIILKFNSATSFATDSGARHDPDVPCGMPYLRIKKNSASSWDFGVGPTPRSFVNVWTAFNIGSWVTPNKLGFGGQTSSAAGIMWSVDSVRFS